ncbi:MAG: glycosyltransferase family 2 protein [Bryobacteraceae bacterium]
MSSAQVTVVIPTLAADSALEGCLQALGKQIFRDFDVILVDNSGKGLTRQQGVRLSNVTVIENRHNAGFGAAINQGIRVSSTPYVAALNDDAEPHPEWLAEMVAALESHPEAGMAASRILLAREGCLDSAGMLVCGDGSSKQRGHGQPPSSFPDTGEVLFPSACAALYRRALLDETGGFDEDFFLYAEDTDLGLRARWAGWKCLYVPGATVNHGYSHSAGSASPLKAYYVERNRLFVLAKNFPAPAILRAPWVALARYFWHTLFLLGGRGSAARFREEGNNGLRLVWYVIRAHCALIRNLPALWKKRRAIRRGARIPAAEFLKLLQTHAISAREMAAL